MDGKLRVDDSYITLNVIGLLSGLIILGFFAFLSLRGWAAPFTLNDTLIFTFLLIYGVFVTALCGAALFMSRKVFFRVDDASVSAFCQKGFSLRCSFEEIAFLELLNSGLSIRLKNGRRYKVFFLDNAMALYRYIRKRMPAGDDVSADKSELLSAIDALVPEKKRAGRVFLIGIFLLIPLIFLQGFSIGVKELRRFSASDWAVFAVFFLVMLTIAAVSVVFYIRSERLDEELRSIGAALDLALLRAEPLPIGNVLKLFVNEDRYDPYRLTVFGFPDSPQVYYILERVAAHRLLRTFDSDFYDSFAELAPELDGLKEIPLPPAEP